MQHFVDAVSLLLWAPGEYRSNRRRDFVKSKRFDSLRPDC